MVAGTGLTARTEFEAADEGPVPEAFTAATVNV
jgi:hypothetical protein